MKAEAKNIRLQFDKNRQCELVLTVDMPAANAIAEVFRLKGLAADGKPLELEVKERKRSTKANACLWKLCEKIADIRQCAKEDVYLEMLRRYGVSAHIIAGPESLGRLKEGWRAYKVLGGMNPGAKKGVHVQCFFGSHLYDAKEFLTLLNGVKAEAKALGIEV